MAFKKATGNWTDLRSLCPKEIDLHFGRHDPDKPYLTAMAEVEDLVEQSLKTAQAEGRSYVMFTHGWSTSRPGQTTARSVVRGFMRSPKATPLIVRKECIQHESVFVAKIRQA
jgi:hypothetical protein